MPDFRAHIRKSLPAHRAPGVQEAEIVEELALDFEERYEHALRQGADPAEAWRRIQGQIRALRGERQLFGGAWRVFGQDIRYGGRMLRKNLAFTAVAVFTLALCLGANLTIFAVVDAILLRPLPFPYAERLVTAIHSYPLMGVPRSAASLPNYYDYREKIRAFASVTMIHEYSGPTMVGGAGSPYRVQCDRVSPEFFSTLEVPLLMGRTFSDQEMTYPSSHVAVLTYEFWRSYFNADPHVLGRTFQVDTVTTTIIGVLPPNFRVLSRRALIYTPAASDPSERAPDQRHNNRIQLIARLAPGATLAMARAQIDALNAEQFKDDPYAGLIKSSGFFTIVDPLREDHVRTIKPTLLLLECGALFLLLIAGVNLVNLLLIRASGRAKELAIRQSLGASRWHVISQVATETVLLSLLGGVLGLGVAAGGIRLLAALGADQLPLGGDIAFDGRLAVAALLAAVAMGALIAIPLAWFNLRSHLANALQSETRSATGGRAAQRLRHSFIMGQIALAFVLLTGAGMLGISLKHVLDTSPGFQTEQVFTGQFTLPYNNYQKTETRVRFMERLAATIKMQPGITSAGIGTLMPFGGNDDNGITSVDGSAAVRKGSPHSTYRNGVAGDYWRVMGIRPLGGRLLEDADNDRPQRVCVVDQAFAHRYWPGRSALGHRLMDGADFKPEEAFTVVGVVGSVKQSDLAGNEPLGTVYYPYKYWPITAVSVVVRTSMMPEVVAPLLRKAVLELDPQLPIDHLQPMQSWIDQSLVARRSPAVLAGIFAGVALLLTAVGTYGVLAYAVGQRRREIGLRMALGARPEQVLAHFLRVGTTLLAAGVTLGLFGAWAAGRMMRGFLFGVGALSPGVLAATAGMMIGIVLLATFLPAYRAARVSPTEALRDE